jgi:hypothetical protein
MAMSAKARTDSASSSVDHFKIPRLRASVCEQQIKSNNISAGLDAHAHFIPIICAAKH